MLTRTALTQDSRAQRMLAPGARLALHSVFEHALNLVDQSGDLLTLLGPRGGNGPATVVLDAPPTEGLRQPWPTAGQPVGVDWGGHLTIGGWLTVRRTTVALWEPQRELSLVHPLQRRANLDVAVVLGRRATPGLGLGGLLAHRADLLAEPSRPAPSGMDPLLAAAWEGLAALLPAWRRGDSGAVAAAPGRLVGLGPGQTPSGDDLLAGLIVASRRRWPDDPRWDPLGQTLVEAARGQTSDLGFARLTYAAAGEIDERSDRALAALLAGDPSTVEHVCRDVLGYGHSSGIDTLVGLILGCADRRHLDGRQPTSWPGHKVG